MSQGVFRALRFATVLHTAGTKAARREVGVGGDQEAGKSRQRGARGLQSSLSPVIVAACKMKSLTWMTLKALSALKF